MFSTLRLSGALMLLLLPAIATAQIDNRFTRTQATGHWNDGEWHNPGGSSGITPPVSSEVYIGDGTLFTESSLPATVDVYTNESVGRLFIGPVPTGGETRTGTIQITTGQGQAADPITSGQLTVNNDATIRQGTLLVDSGSSFTSTLLNVDGVLSVLDNQGTLVTNGLTVSNGGSATLSGDVTVSTVNVITGGSILIDTNTGMDFDSVAVDGSGLTLDGNSMTTGDIAVTNGGTLNLTSGLHDVDGVLRVVNSTLNRAGGTLDLNDVELTGANTLTLQSADAIAGSALLDDGAQIESFDVRTMIGLSLSNGSQFFQTQGADELEGLTLTSLSIDSGSSLALEFDPASAPGTFDWALRLVGDQSGLLSSFLGDGRIVVNGLDPSEDFLVQYGGAGDDYTYITAVPEPATGFVLTAVFAGLAIRRRR